MAFQRILVPLDFSDCSLRALEMARDLAKEHGASMLVFHAGDIQRALGQHWAEEFLPVDPDMQEASKLERDRLTGSLKRIVHDVVGDAVPTDTLVRMGFPAEEILDQIQAGNHDLIVMGTHGRTGLRRMLLGSVAERVLHHATVPVLVVH